MKTKILMMIMGIILVIASCQNSEGPRAEKTNIKSPEVVDYRALPFELDEVTLREGPFKHALELNIQSLLNYQPDRFLAKFRKNAGLEPKA